MSAEERETLLMPGDKVVNYQGKIITIDHVEHIPAGLLIHGTFDEWDKWGVLYEAQGILVEAKPPSRPVFNWIVRGAHLVWISYKERQFAVIAMDRPDVRGVFDAMTHSEIVERILHERPAMKSQEVNS